MQGLSAYYGTHSASLVQRPAVLDVSLWLQSIDPVDLVVHAAEVIYGSNLLQMVASTIIDWAL